MKNNLNDIIEFSKSKLILKGKIIAITNYNCYGIELITDLDKIDNIDKFLHYSHLIDLSWTKYWAWDLQSYVSDIIGRKIYSQWINDFEIIDFIYTMDCLSNNKSEEDNAGLDLL